MFADQRRRLRAATIELVADGGYKRVTVRDLSRTAGVSTRTFYRQFANLTDCIGFASESTMLCALEAMKEATSSTRDREDACRTAISSLMRYLASNPDAATVALADAFDGGPSVVVRLQTATGTFEPLFADLVGARPGPVTVPRQLVSGMVAGVLRVVRATALAGRTAELPEFATDLSHWMLSLASPPSEDASRPFSLTRPSIRFSRETNPRYTDAAREGDERERILRATVRLAVVDGFATLTIPRIRRVAGVSRRSFNTYFAGVPECFLAAIEWLARLAAARARAWATGDGDRDLRIRRLMVAICAQVARNGPLAKLVLVGVLDPGRAGLLRREGLLELGVQSLRSELAPAVAAGDIALNASMAAAWEIAAAEVADGRASRLPGLSPLLAHVILAPALRVERDRQH